ncbi:MAG: DUF1016 N-terminal domain-containing protein, partial [Rhodoferax sp.]
MSTLSAKLSWSHMVVIMAHKNADARQFYAQQAAQDGWSVRELSHHWKPPSCASLKPSSSNWAGEGFGDGLDGSGAFGQ